MRVFFQTIIKFFKRQILITCPNISKCFQIQKSNVFAGDLTHQVQSVVTVAFFNHGKAFHEIQRVHAFGPFMSALVIVSRAAKMQGFFEATDGGREVTEFDVDFCLFNIDLGNGLVVEKNFVEFNKSLFEIIVF